MVLNVTVQNSLNRQVTVLRKCNAAQYFENLYLIHLNETVCQFTVRSITIRGPRCTVQRFFKTWKQKLVRVREGKKPVAFRVEFCSVTGFFFPCVPWGICGKKQGFHINDDRVPLYRRKREIRDDGLCSPHLRLLTWPHDIWPAGRETTPHSNVHSLTVRCKVVGSLRRVASHVELWLKL